MPMIDAMTLSKLLKNHNKQRLYNKEWRNILNDLNDDPQKVAEQQEIVFMDGLRKNGSE